MVVYSVRIQIAPSVCPLSNIHFVLVHEHVSDTLTILRTKPTKQIEGSLPTAEINYCRCSVSQKHIKSSLVNFCHCEEPTGLVTEYILTSVSFTCLTFYFLIKGVCPRGCLWELADYLFSLKPRDVQTWVVVVYFITCAHLRDIELNGKTCI